MTEELVDRASDNRAVPPWFAVYAESSSMLRLTGELDLLGAPAFASALEPLTQRGGTTGLDLTELTFMDASGINALCQAARHVGERGRIVVLRPTTSVRRVLDITGVVAVIAIDDNPPFLTTWIDGTAAFTCNGLTATIVGTGGDDVLEGTAGANCDRRARR